MSARKPFACSACGRSFASPAARRRHDRDSRHGTFLTPREAAELASADGESIGADFIAMWMAGYGPDEHGEFLTDLSQERRR